MKRMKKLSAVCSFVMSICMLTSCGALDFIGLGGGQSSSEQATTVGYDVVIYSLKGEGNITFDKQKVQEGDSLTITIQASYGFQLSSIKINNVEYIENVANGQLCIENVTENITIRAVFEEVAYAAYVAESNAPVIDGVVDSVWDNSYTFAAKNQYLDNAEGGATFTYEEIGYTKVMWNESGLYFLGVVYDNDLVYGDVCNFWVSEEYLESIHITDKETGKTVHAKYSTDPTDGRYAMTVAVDGNNYLYTGFDVTQYWTCGTQVTDFGYVIEIFMPRMGSKSLTAGNAIGFDVSIDYRSGEAASRDYYANWNGFIYKCAFGGCPVAGYVGGNHGYWQSPAALAKVILLGPNE